MAEKNKWFALLKNLYLRFRDDEVPALGAQLAYYLVLSFFPFLIFLLTLSSYLPFDGEKVIAGLSGLLPAESYNLTAGIIRHAVGARSGTLLPFGMAATVWAASNGVLALIRGINKAYDIRETRPFWKVRGISILFTIALALSIILAFAMLVFGRMLGEFIFGIMGISAVFTYAWNIFRYLITLALLMPVFVSLYLIMPNRRLSIKQVLPGSMFSSLGWVLASMLFSYYVDSFRNYSTMYGSIGGIIILLVWLYLSSVIILLGGEINARSLPENGRFQA